MRGQSDHVAQQLYAQWDLLAWCTDARDHVGLGKGKTPSAGDSRSLPGTGRPVLIGRANCFGPWGFFGTPRGRQPGSWSKQAWQNQLTASRPLATPCGRWKFTSCQALPRLLRRAAGSKVVLGFSCAHACWKCAHCHQRRALAAASMLACPHASPCGCACDSQKLP